MTHLLPFIEAGLLRSTFQKREAHPRSTLRVECGISDAPRPVSPQSGGLGGHSTQSVERELGGREKSSRMAD